MASISGDFSTSLVSHFKLEEASGTRSDELSTNPLTQVGGAIDNAVAIQGDGADFESANSRYLQNSTPSGLTSTTSYSCSFWYKPESTGTQAIVALIGVNDRQNKATFFLVGGKIYFRRNNTGAAIIDVISTTTLSAGTWYHVMATFSTTNGMVLYINGSSEATSSDLTATPSDSWKLNVGARFRVTADLYTDGVVDELSLWDGIELTSGNATTIYNAGAGIPYAAGGPAAQAARRGVVMMM